MIEFLRRIFGPTTTSSAAAKDRLRLVLMTDHLELAPDMIEAMKRDLVDVISRYVEVDRDKIEVNFEQQDKALAMLANIPILSVNRPSNGQSAVARGPEEPPSATTVAVGEPVETDVALPGAPKRRRRRRRKSKPAEVVTPVQ